MKKKMIMAARNRKRFATFRNWATSCLVKVILLAVNITCLMVQMLVDDLYLALALGVKLKLNLKRRGQSQSLSSCCNRSTSRDRERD